MTTEDTTHTPPSQDGQEPNGDLMARIAELEADLEKTKDLMLRTAADAENLRRRVEREKQEFSKYAIANFAKDLLSVADNMARTLSALKPEDRTENQVLDQLALGIELTQNDFQTTLKKHGVELIETVGHPFDPHFHQAVTEVPSDLQQPGHVVEQFAAGYKIGDRLLRPAMVSVALRG